MLNQPTLEKLQTMKLHGMADAFPRPTGNHRHQRAEL
jgi:hypothetical protein